MKFFSDFYSCYRSAVQARQEEPATSMQVALMGGERRKRSKTNRMNGSKYWRPALSVISEDGVVSFIETDQGKAQPEKKVSCKNRSTAANKTRNSHYYDELDYYHSRKNSMPVIVPAFSPTPFMF